MASPHKKRRVTRAVAPEAQPPAFQCLAAKVVPPPFGAPNRAIVSVETLVHARTVLAHNQVSSGVWRPDSLSLLFSLAHRLTRCNTITSLNAPWLGATAPPCLCDANHYPCRPGEASTCLRYAYGRKRLMGTASGVTGLIYRPLEDKDPVLALAQALTAPKS